MRVKLLVSLIVLLLALPVSSADLTTPPVYRFQLSKVTVIDGDTLNADVYLPFGVLLYDQRIRVLGVDAWEMKGEESEKGKIAKEYTQSMVQSGTVWVSPTGKRTKDNFGRLLAFVYVESGGVWRDLRQELIDNKHGEPASE